MRSKTPTVAFGLALPGFLLFGLIVVPIAIFGALAAAGTAIAWWNAGPNYTLAATTTCLRAHGYSVSRPYPYRWAGKADPTVEVDGARDTEYLSFTPSTAKAEADSRASDYGLVTRRNVVFNAEGINGLPPQAAPIVSCLRSS